MTNNIKHILDSSVRKKIYNGMTNHEINKDFIVKILEMREELRLKYVKKLK